MGMGRHGKLRSEFIRKEMDHRLMGKGDSGWILDEVSSHKEWSHHPWGGSRDMEMWH